MLKISKQPNGHPEIFHSLQGEGVNMGRPAVFLRLALCNLACTWCDTRYTWDWDQYDIKEQIIEMQEDEVEQEILKYHCNYLVITGGEPMIQQQEIIPSVKRLKDKGICTEVETNGTIIPCSELASLIDYWSVSPKLSNSGNSQTLREMPESYRFFNALPSIHFKYVLREEDDFREVQRVIRANNLEHEKVILMPEAQDPEVLTERSRWLAELCKDHGYLFSTRLQILLWGNKRGV